MEKVFTIIAVVIFTSACASTKTADISGKWMMYKVIQNSQDVTDEHNPHKERYVILQKDNRFESGGRPYGSNTGDYVFDAEKSTLFLDSDVGPNDDSNWKIELRGDTMVWQGYGTEWAEGFKMIQVRAN